MFSVVSKESAFVHAIASASVLHTLSRSCDSGYSNCPCLHRYEYDVGVCSSSIRFALRYGRKFIDAREKVSKDAQSIVNLHNNRVGRRVSFIVIELFVLKNLFLDITKTSKKAL